MWNIGANKFNRDQPKGQRAEVKLLDISDYFAVGSVPPNYDNPDSLTLYTNPQEISRSLEAVYGSANGLLSTYPARQYSHSSRSPIQLTGVLIDTRCNNADATPFLDRLEAMTIPTLNSYPPVLALVWGSRVIQPVVLTNLNVTETGWANGLVSQASVDFTFEYVKLPLYKSSADERRLKMLTEREKANIKKRAEDDLKKKANTKPTIKPAKKGVNNPSKVINKPNRSGNKLALTVRDDGSVYQGNTLVAKYEQNEANVFGTVGRGIT